MTPVYGMAEATLVVTAPVLGESWHSVSVDRDKLGVGDRVERVDGALPDARAVVACGRPAPAIEVRVADTDGTPYADGVVGEVQITGPAVTAGYLGLADAAQPFTADRWLRTGDLGFRLDGDLYIVGRLKDMITVRGQNFYAEDVEEIVRTTPGVDRARNAAIAWDDDGDERMIVLWETSLDPDAARILTDAARDRVKLHLGLEAVDVIAVPPATIPHTTSGKVRRQAAVRLAHGHRAGAGARPADQPADQPEKTADLVTEGETR
jgi:acyl-CoA synthetase (AMP-forming)/AMP-acid ligase II